MEIMADEARLLAIMRLRPDGSILTSPIPNRRTARNILLTRVSSKGCGALPHRTETSSLPCANVSGNGLPNAPDVNKGCGSRLPPFLQFKVMPYGYCREKAHKLCWAIPAIMMGVSFQASGRPVAIIRPEAGSTRARNAQRRKVDRVRHADRALCQPCAG